MFEKIYRTINANLLFDNVFEVYASDTTIDKIRAFVADMFEKYHFSKAIATDFETREKIAIFCNDWQAAHEEGLFDDDSQDDWDV